MNTVALSTSVPLIIANLLLGVVVAVPLLLVLVAVCSEAVDRIRRRRAIEWVELEGIGRIPVLRA